MPANLFTAEWLDQNANRHYPLAEDATGRDASGSFTLPDSFLLEILLPIHAGLAIDSTKFFLGRVSIHPAGYALTIFYDNGTAHATIVATTSISRASHVVNSTYAIAGVGDFADTVGRVTIGSLEAIDAGPAGDFVLTPAGGKLDLDCLRPQIRGISSITIISSGQVSIPIRGAVEFAAGSNSKIYASIGANGVTRITLDAIDGTGLNDPCNCAANLGPPIRTINGIGPTAGGNFTIYAADCIDITGSAHGITLADTCSKPCAGCAELEQLTSQLAIVGLEQRTMANQINRLETQHGAFQNNVLASRLADYPCTTC